MSNVWLLILRDLIVTCFQTWCITFLMSNEQYRCKRLFRLAFFLIIVIAIVFMSYNHSPILIKFATIVIIITWLGKYVYDCPRSKLLLYGVITVVLEYCCELIMMQSWSIFNEPVYSQNIIYDDFVLNLVLMTNVLYFILMFIIGKNMKHNRMKIRLRESYPIIISGIPFLIVLTCLHISLPIIHEKNIRFGFLISAVAIFIAFIFNVIYIQNYLIILEKNREEQHTVDELKLKNEYYLQKLDTEEKVKEIYHDLKNYFLLSDSEIITKEIQKKLNLYERFYETGNDFLNIVIAEKISKAYELGIHIECHIDFSRGGFIEPLDISTIFGNLIDNALEATQKIEKEERYIFVDVSPKRNLMIIVIRNSMNGSKSNDLVTGKWNSSFHGYGLKNVDKSVKNYGGEIKININEKEFEVNIVIPIPTN